MLAELVLSFAVNVNRVRVLSLLLRSAVRHSIVYFQHFYGECKQLMLTTVPYCCCCTSELLFLLFSFFIICFVVAVFVIHHTFFVLIGALTLPIRLSAYATYQVPRIQTLTHKRCPQKCQNVNERFLAFPKTLRFC